MVGAGVVELVVVGAGVVVVVVGCRVVELVVVGIGVIGKVPRRPEMQAEDELDATDKV